MRVLQVFKRLAPFFLTFSLGLLVASFFVTVAAPRFEFRGFRSHRDCNRLRYDNRWLKDENSRLMRENAELKRQSLMSGVDADLDVPPPPLPPAPPKPPAAPRSVR